MDVENLTLDAFHALWICTEYHGSAQAAVDLALWHRLYSMSRPWYDVSNAAHAVAAWRGEPVQRDVKSYLAALAISNHPGEHGSLFFWAFVTGERPGRMVSNDAWRQSLWVERVILAYLLGLPVSADVHAVCRAAELSSSLSAESVPVSSPCGDLPDEVAMDALLWQFRLR